MENKEKVELLNRNIPSKELENFLRNREKNLPKEIKELEMFVQNLLETKNGK